MQRRSGARTQGTGLVLVVALILGGIWLMEQLAQSGFGPAWFQSLWATGDNAGQLRVGVVAGHRGSDSGAVCPDGLTEAEVNEQVAKLVVQDLLARGIQAELLDEFDPKLRGYRAAAFVSIHSDSCTVPFSGFKVARYQWGSAASERLAQCLWDRYEAVTGLLRHPDTVTVNMTRYHAFREIAGSTPGAIIELGFLNADRNLLTQQPERVAEGVVAGILCFLSGQ
ncbi:MAG: N-acetylmuramoyl-L-alanine amidase [Anaerolineae bacterium]|nr:N-acetylmuramoyl-L-alanine amidase [Anaerolineae bacterium]